MNEGAVRGWARAERYALPVLLAVTAAAYMAVVNAGFVWDDKGLVLPPTLAPIQVAFVPIFKKDPEQVISVANRLADAVRKVASVHVDDRDNVSPGWKFNDWEQRGVCLRVEIGPKDIEKNQAVVVRRDTGEKEFVSQDNLVEIVEKLLQTMQKDLLDKAKKLREENSFTMDAYDEFKEFFAGDGGFVRCHWCEDAVCEAKVQDETKATIRCVEFDRPDEKGECIVCGKPSPGRVVFAKSY